MKNPFSVLVNGWKRMAAERAAMNAKWAEVDAKLAADREAFLAAQKKRVADFEAEALAELPGRVEAFRAEAVRDFRGRMEGSLTDARARVGSSTDQFLAEITKGRKAGRISEEGEAAARSFVEQVLGRVDHSIKNWRGSNGK